MGLWHEQPRERVEIPLHFFAFDWRTSDEMQLSFGWRRNRLTDPDLKTDPRGQTTNLVPSRAATGEIIPVCELRRHPITAAVARLLSRPKRGVCRRSLEAPLAVEMDDGWKSRVRVNASSGICASFGLGYWLPRIRRGL